MDDEDRKSFEAWKVILTEDLPIPNRDKMTVDQCKEHIISVLLSLPDKNDFVWLGISKVALFSSKISIAEYEGATQAAFKEMFKDFEK